MALRLFGRTFRFYGWGLALALLASAGAVALGHWQAGRAEQRRALAVLLDSARRGEALELPGNPVNAADYIGRRVAVRGVFVDAHTVLLEYRMRRGRAGYEVLTPMRIGASERHVLVNRGWVPAQARRERVPHVLTPPGEQRIEGIALERLPRTLGGTAAPPEGRVRQNLDIGEFSASSGLALQPMIVEQLSPAEDGLDRNWPHSDAAYEKNEMYALQWYSLAALAIALYLVLSFRRDAAPRA